MLDLLLSADAAAVALGLVGVGVWMLARAERRERPAPCARCEEYSAHIGKLVRECHALREDYRELERLLLLLRRSSPSCGSSSSSPREEEEEEEFSLVEYRIPSVSPAALPV